MTPREVVERWVELFNAGDAAGLAELYAPDATNHQVVFDEPLKGREAIKQLFELDFSRATMVCEPANLLECDEWVALEWRDPLGLRGCGFFRVEEGLITVQRGYFDQLTFFKLQGLPIPDKYLSESERR